MSKALQRVSSEDVELAEMQSWTEARRKQELGECLRMTAQTLQRAARILAVMEAAGDYISDIPAAFVAFMRRIRAGQMLAETYLQFDGSTRVKVASLPLPDQRRLTEGDTVDLVVLREGKTEILKMDPRCLQPKQLKQVFDRDHIRSHTEQVAWLEDQSRADAVASKAHPEIEVSTRKGGLIVRGLLISRKELAQYLAQLG